jgi:hypothetical protein
MKTKNRRELEERYFKSVDPDESRDFLSDAPQSTIDSLPEVDWVDVKKVLINFGYSVIEINDSKN